MTAEASSTEVGARDASASGTMLAGFFVAIFGPRFSAAPSDQLATE
jgi:hypothetical protein